MLSPGTGNSPGILSVLGNLKLSLGSTYLVDLNGSAVGTQYDQTSVTGTITLENAILSLRIGGPLLAGEQFTILNNDGTDGVIGQFSGLPEGGTFTAGSQTFTISYQGNDGNDVVLTAVVPEPATWVLLTGGIALVVVCLDDKIRGRGGRMSTSTRDGDELQGRARAVNRRRCWTFDLFANNRTS